MITRSLLNKYLEPTLGESKNSRQGLSFNCPICDEGKKYNLEIDIDRKIFNCWGCKYSGTVRKLLRDRATDASWQQLPEFRSHISAEEESEKPINFPTATIPVHLNKDVREYLVGQRGMNIKELTRRGVSYVHSENETYYNHIFFPFYKDGRLVGACLQNFGTKAYRNLGKFNFVPWEEFLNPNYPITVAEGAYDGLSGVNATILRGTDVFPALLEFLRGKDVILALDNRYDFDHLKDVLKAIEKAEPRGLVLFNLNGHEDMNRYFLDDPKRFFKEYRDCFQDLKR